jgi:hypothetical protein
VACGLARAPSGSASAALLFAEETSQRNNARGKSRRRGHAFEPAQDRPDDHGDGLAAGNRR